MTITYPQTARLQRKNEGEPSVGRIPHFWVPPLNLAPNLNLNLISLPGTD